MFHKILSLCSMMRHFFVYFVVFLDVWWTSTFIGCIFIYWGVFWKCSMFKDGYFRALVVSIKLAFCGLKHFPLFCGSVVTLHNRPKSGWLFRFLQKAHFFFKLRNAWYHPRTWGKSSWLMIYEHQHGTSQQYQSYWYSKIKLYRK